MRRAALLANAPVRAAASTTSAPVATHVAQRLAALETPLDVVRRLPVGAPAAVVRTSAPEVARTELTRRAALLPNATAVATPHTPHTSHPSDGAPERRVPTRRSPLLPNAPAALVRSDVHADVVAAERLAQSPTANHIARRLAAAESPLDAVRRLPVGVGSSTAIVVTATGTDRIGPSAAPSTGATTPASVRRSLALPTAPTSSARPHDVLPGIRATSRAPRTARSARQGAASTTAARLREMVATGAFEGTTPTSASRALPVKPAPVLRTAVDRFEHALASAPSRDTPTALPARFRPLAERIVGP
jgi:hypothetical protein